MNYVCGNCFAIYRSLLERDTCECAAKSEVPAAPETTATKFEVKAKVHSKCSFATRIAADSYIKLCHDKGLMTTRVDNGCGVFVSAFEIVQS